MKITVSDSYLSALLTFLVALALPLSLPAQTEEPPQRDDPAVDADDDELADDEAEEKPDEKLAVVVVGKEVLILGVSEVAGHRKELDAEHQERVAAWKEAKREARAAKTKFKEPMPKKPRYQVVSKSLASREKAEKLRDKTLARVDPWIVVALGTRLEAMRRTDLKELEKTAEAEFKERLKAWEEARKTAFAARQNFVEKKPVLTKPKVLADRLPHEEAANARLAEIRKRGEKKVAGRRPARKKPAPKPTTQS